MENHTLADYPELHEFGWTARWQALFAEHRAEDRLPARVLRGDRGSALVQTPQGVERAKSSVRLLKETPQASDLPIVGDWVVLHRPEDLDFPQIEKVLERKSAIRRGDPDKTSDTQVLAANVDVIFVVHPIADAPHLRRIERELSLAWDASAKPVVVLSKADLSTDPEGCMESVASIALGVDILLVNALEKSSCEQLLKYITGHQSAVLFGPSGAGKSTIINSILGEDRLSTQEVREVDGGGRHTTVARELINSPGSGIIIDTPGLRVLGLTGSAEGISSAFSDIEELALACRFRDCSHNHEPGCAVQIAIEGSTLLPERLASYNKLMKEAQFAARKTDARLRAEEESKWKLVSKAAREFNKRKKRD